MDGVSNVCRKPANMTLTVQSGQPLRGEVIVPGDKSLSHRAALFAALAGGADVLALLNRPDLTPIDRAFLQKLAHWRAPGADGLHRLRAIAERGDPQ